LDREDKIAGLLFKPRSAASEAAPKKQPTESYTKVANRLVELINAGDCADIQTNFNKGMDAELPFAIKEMTQQFGKIQKLGKPEPDDEAMVFRAQCEKGALDMQIALDSRGLIAGLNFTPHVETNPAPEKHQTQLSLPFKGRWLVFWGGDTRELNA